jgi:hypothetical protein
MSQNKVTVILDGIDRLSPVLKGLQSSTQGLGAGAVLMGNLYTKEIEQAANAVGGLINRFSEASDMQTSAIGLAGQFSAMTGKSYAAAGEMIKGMTADFANLAAKLPGATQDYKNLGLAISDTLIKANTENGVFNEDAFKKQTMSLTQTLGLLKATNSELLTSDVQLYFTKFSEGASEAELASYKLNDVLPGMYGELEKASKKLYGESAKLQDLTLQQRTKVMEVATRNLAPPEMIADLEKTASSQIEAFKTTLFDQDTGIFGFLRSVTTVNGKSKTVMDGFAALLTEIFGSEGLFATAGEALGFMGLEAGDPMLALYNGLMALKDWAVSAGDFLRAQNFPDLTKMNPSELGKFLADQYSKGTQWVRDSVGKMVSDGTFKNIGSNIGDLFNKGINFLGEFFKNTDWGALAESAANMIAGAIDTVIAFLSKVDWGQVAQTLGAVLNAFITFASTFGEKIRGHIMTKGGEILGTIGKWAGDRLSELWKAIQDTVSGWLTSAKNVVMNAITGSPQPQASQPPPQQKPEPKPEVVQPASTFTQELFQGFATGLNTGNLFSAIASESRAMPSGSGIAIANTSETILNRSQQSDLISLVSGAMSNRRGGTFAPQVIVQAAPGMDVNALASRVMQEIDQRFQQYQLASM